MDLEEMLCEAKEGRKKEIVNQMNIIITSYCKFTNKKEEDVKERMTISDYLNLLKYCMRTTA